MAVATRGGKKHSSKKAKRCISKSNIRGIEKPIDKSIKEDSSILEMKSPAFVSPTSSPKIAIATPLLSSPVSKSEKETDDVDAEDDTDIKIAASILLLMSSSAYDAPNSEHTVSTPEDSEEDQSMAHTDVSSGLALPPLPQSSFIGMTLSMPDDGEKLNSLHCFVRSHLLELFVADKESKSSSKVAGRVGLRCVHCAHIPRKLRDGGAKFFPRTLGDIYRSVCTWQRLHFQCCRYVPEEVKATYWELKRTDRTRGKTRYWIESARLIGLTDDIGEVGNEDSDSPSPSPMEEGPVGGIHFVPINLSNIEKSS